MKWEYKKQDIGNRSDRPVAIAFNEKGEKLFLVKEGKDFYFTQPCNTYLKSALITYKEVQDQCTSEELQKNAGKILYSVLVHACEYFEKEYNKQREQVIKDFNLWCEPLEKGESCYIINKGSEGAYGFSQTSYGLFNNHFGKVGTTILKDYDEALEKCKELERQNFDLEY